MGGERPVEVGVSTGVEEVSVWGRRAPRVEENEAVRGKTRREKPPEAAACCTFGCITS